MTLTELLVAPAAEPARLRTAREALTALSVAVHRPTEAIAVEAARLRERYPVSLPDAYLLATARGLAARPATFDQRVLSAAQRERIASGEGAYFQAQERSSSARAARRSRANLVL